MSICSSSRSPPVPYAARQRPPPATPCSTGSSSISATSSRISARPATSPAPPSGQGHLRSPHHRPHRGLRQAPRDVHPPHRQEVLLGRLRAIPKHESRRHQAPHRRRPRAAANNAGTLKLAHVSKHGKLAVTAYRVLDKSDLGSLLECRPVTGRLHQIRIHLEAIGLPDSWRHLLCPTPRSSRCAAVSFARTALAFAHPITGQMIDIPHRRARRPPLNAPRLRPASPGL